MGGAQRGVYPGDGADKQRQWMIMIGAQAGVSATKRNRMAYEMCQASRIFQQILRPFKRRHIFMYTNQHRMGDTSVASAEQWRSANPI